MPQTEDHDAPAYVFKAHRVQVSKLCILPVIREAWSWMWRTRRKGPSHWMAKHRRTPGQGRTRGFKNCGEMVGSEIFLCKGSLDRVLEECK
jgi:hypothetical protein